MPKNNSGNNRGEALVGAIARYDFTAPTDWLECTGSVISQSTYSDLYNVIGFEYTTTAVSLTFTDSENAGGDYGRQGAWHPDGGYIASPSISTNKQLVVYSFDGTLLTEKQAINLGVVGRCATWSPDGNYVVVASDVTNNQLRAYSWSSGTETLTLQDTANLGANVFFVEYSHDGNWIAVGSAATGKQLTIYSFNGTTLTEEETIDIGQGVQCFAWSSDDTYLAVTAQVAATYTLSVYSWNSGTKALAFVAGVKPNGEHSGYGPRWSQSGDYLFFTASNIYAYSFNGTTLTLVETVAPPVSNFTILGLSRSGDNLISGGHYHSTQASADVLAVYAWNEGAETLTRSGGISRNNTQGNFFPVLSPDHKFVAADSFFETGTTINVFSTGLECNTEINFVLPAVTDNIIRAI